ncbi:CDP-alcohol phosphatidyltransferase family protein [Actinomadura scrupuli]|uniref:CDP-alcohol phosphatidyltransferase family protein n=1 Tax=Actinomadura scrupuli TaxID=559629 RepID=UPI003D96CD02
MATYSLDDVRGVWRKRDAWWTVLLVDPVAVRLTRLLANRTSLTPDHLTLASFAVGLAAAGCFAAATPYWLALGALAYHVSFILDCCDGKIARLKGTGTPFGPWLDYVVDRLRMLCCTVALVGGQYARTGRVELFYLGFMILALDMFRHLNAVHTARTRRAIRHRLGAAAELAGLPEPAGDGRYTLPSQDERLRYVEDLLHAGGRAARSGPIPAGRARWYDQARGKLQSRCERTQMVTGVEFQMALFVVGPSTGLIAPVALAAGGLLMAFEVIAIYRLWSSTRECEELVGDLAAAVRGGPGGSTEGSATRGRRLSDAGVR